MPSFDVKQGHSYLGAGDRPRVFVSRESVRLALEARGFVEVSVMDRADWDQALREAGGAPLALRSLPGYVEGEWNTVARGRWVRPAEALVLPIAPAWLMEFPVGARLPPGRAALEARTIDRPSRLVALGGGLVLSAGAAAAVAWRAWRAWRGGSAHA